MKEEVKPVEEKDKGNKPDDPGNKPGTPGGGVPKGVVGTLIAIALEFIWKNRNDIVDLVKRIFKKKPKPVVTPEPVVKE